MALFLLLHVLSVVVWVGGMFFAYMALRPVAANVLEPPQRLTLWAGVFGKFFPWVWASVATILLTGLTLLIMMGRMPHYVLAMLVLGVAMMLIFAHVFFSPYKKLKRAVGEKDWQNAVAALAKIRRLIGINLSLGLLTIAVVFIGRGLT
ncbi:CopD domain-containing protein [Candidatus Nitrotoga sp. BS]|uniref:CopD family protein n=1 Tax=Candidatus Nitrotoga sp. BS TaxID=2890408 RepID=UPI001EF2DA72|nr:CopD family protein [Candidatus Nitrotoga sp. BS]CAH1210518.1 CopD domain-containing protein [Candidatus Nitrotoga sp. BS]